MPETINIRYYDIHECGLYRGNEFQFGSIGSILQQLTAWYNDRAQNSPFSDRKTHDRLDDLLPAYCFSIVTNQDNSLYLLTLWNETYQNEGAVLSINNDSMGRGEHLPINETHLPDESIPGFATYFLFSPHYNQVAVIKFEHTALLGRNQLDFFIKYFIKMHSDYVISREDENLNREILGYRSDDTQEIQKLNAKFKTVVKRLPTVVENIVERCGDIRKIIVHKNIRNQIPDDRNFFIRVSQWFAGVEYQAQNQDLHIKSEINIEPTAEDLQTTINHWLDEQHENNENLGFKFRGDDEITWIDSMISKQENEIEVVRINNEIVMPDSLLNAVVNIVRFQN